MKILAVEWRSAVDTIGIVLIENEMGEQSARIGTTARFGEAIPFTSTEKEDRLYIAHHGAKLSFREAKAFFPNIEEENYKK